MKKIMRTLKRWVLRIQIKNCESTANQLKMDLEAYHELIMRKIVNGASEARIERLQLEREGLVETHRDVVIRKYNLLDQLREA